MRKPITVINVALLIVAIWLGISIRATWRQNHARYSRLSTRAPRAVPANASGAKAELAEAASYSELVNRNLFSVDRNNVQPVIKEDKKPKPPAPYTVGTLKLSSGMVALMAEPKEAGQGKFHRMRVGDEIGGYKIVEITDRNVVIEFDGEKTSIDVYESAASVPGVSAYTLPTTSSSGRDNSQVTTAVPVGVVGTSPASGSSNPADPANAANVNVDPSGKPTVTIEGNFRVLRRQTPFGVMISKEPITPGKPQ